MKQIRTWKTIALLLLAVIAVSWSVFLPQTSTATSANYQRMIELGLIDEVKSPEDIGLGYLHHRPPELTASLVDSIRTTTDKARTQLTENITMAIPLGTNEPYPAGSLANDEGQLLDSDDLEAIQYVNTSGQSEGITGRDSMGMFEEEVNNCGSYDYNCGRNNALGERETLVADSRGLFAQTRRVSVIDLIVRSKRNGRLYLLPNIRVDSFCRDALNSIENRSWRRI